TETPHLTMGGAHKLMSALEYSPGANNKLLKAAQGYKDEVHVSKD
ncbi:DUF1778 domain-containing protein, partial [Salmonella enterica subsp. enterica serovar Senftenberg]